MDEQYLGTEIAIVGMSGRFPGAHDVAEFWQNLRDGIESIRFPSSEQGESTGGVLPGDPGFVRASAVADDVDSFDAAFFGYTPREAELMDPQHRVFLEAAWTAMEHAGYAPAAYPGAVGVFAGATTNTYLLHNLANNRAVRDNFEQVQLDMSNGADFLSTRVSYKMDLKGPSYTVQTACSTSLVAVHLACQSLLSEECDLALAGGVSVHVKHPEGYRYTPGNIVSPDGHCRTFDSRAEGTIFGSGVGVVVLERLEDALDHGDHIHAIIKGTAVNNDGAHKVGYAAPSVEGQAAVIAEALAVAGVEADSLTYVEAHGTGTRMGDPVEIQALKKAFQVTGSARGACAIGSVKTNIGHLAGAAGISGLIKTVLALENALIPPSLHFEQPNPEIDFADSPFYVNTELAEWQPRGKPRRAGVSSFGVGGTNAHVILEQAPPAIESGPSRSHQVLLLSARTPKALEAAAANLADHARRHPDLDLADVAYTLQVGRQALGCRRVVVCRDLDEAADALSTDGARRALSGRPETLGCPVAFLFPGQGAQYVNMGLQLYRAEPVFAREVDTCAELLRPHLGLDLRTLLYPDSSGLDEAARRLNQTAITQPALFVIEYAVARLWQSWGVEPQVMIGHSIGEIVAACVAGVFSLGDALMLTALRGQLMQELPPGKMIAISLPEEELESLLPPGVSIAAVNGPSRSTVSGPPEAIETLKDLLDENHTPYRPLRTSHAFHSAMMDPILEPFAEQVARVERNPNGIPFISNVTGTWIRASEATDPGYWARHARQTVRFSDGIHELARRPTLVLLETGPGGTLAKLAGGHFDGAHPRAAFPSMRNAQDNTPDTGYLLTTLGKLWLSGVDIDWQGFSAGEKRCRLPLPTYPFERQRHWIEPEGTLAPGPAAGPGKRTDVADWFYLPSWKRTMPPRPDRPCGSAEHHTWLVFADTCGLGDDLARRLQAEQQDVIRVVTKDSPCRADGDVYCLDPGHPEDYAGLLADLHAAGRQPARFVHCWSITPEDRQEHDGLDRERFERAQARGFYSLISLARALEGQEQDCQIDVVTNRLCDVTGVEELDPEKATLLGACRVIPQEYPQVRCRCLDVRLTPSTPFARVRLGDQLFAGIQTAASGEVLAYRGDQCWEQTREPVRLAGDAGPVRPFRERGVYLFTGGLTGVGFHLAGYLARTVQARLVLIEPPAFPGRDEWPRLLAGDVGQDVVAEKIRRAMALEADGAKVLVLESVISDPAQLRAAIDRGVQHFGEINGVVHAAGLEGEGLFQPIRELGQDACRRCFEPKVFGALALEKALRDRALDFCLLDSSLATVLGGLGYAGYAAANQFVNALALHHGHRQATPVPWVSVSWDAWQSGEAAQITTYSSDLARLAIVPDEGGRALQRILANRCSGHVVVSTADLASRIEQGREKLEARRDRSVSGQGSHLAPRPDLLNAYVAPASDLEKNIVEIWQETLGFERVGVTDSFFDLGADSLMAVQIISRLNKDLNAGLSAASLYESLTVRALGNLIEREDAWSDQAEERQAKMRKRKQFQRERRSRTNGRAPATEPSSQQHSST